jgi:ribosomal-protein-alanine N-acetyltransferase
MRQANTNDAPALYQLAKLAFAGQSPWPLQTFTYLLSRPHKHVLVIEHAQRMVGFIIATQMFDELEIDLIAVHPDYQRQGLAAMLVQQVMTLPEVKRVLLEVAADNLPAQRLYDKLGFTTYHRRQNYYQERGVDALLMEKRYE